MSFFDILIEYKFVIIFYSCVLLLLYLNRKKFQSEGIAYLYKTKIGLGMMDKASERLGKAIRIFGYIGIIVAYIGFVFVSIILAKNAYDLLINKPGAVGGSPVIPGLPIAGLGIKFPLVIGWISLFIIIIVHEFSHGMVARSHGVKIKSSGIVFIGPILGAFVEPDEKQLEKQKHRVQHSVFAAGPFSNIILWLVCLVLVALLSLSVMYVAEPSGIKVDTIKNSTYPAVSSGMKDGTVITGINEDRITNFTTFTDALSKLKPGDTAKITAKDSSVYNLLTVKNPSNESLAFIGVTNFEQDLSPKGDELFNNILMKIIMWLFELFNWTAFISFNIGLINLFPIFITDGARMLKTNMEAVFKDNKKLGYDVWKYINILASMIIIIIIFLPLVRSVFNFLLSFFLTRAF